MLDDDPIFLNLLSFPILVMLHYKLVKELGHRVFLHEFALHVLLLL